MAHLSLFTFYLVMCLVCLYGHGDIICATVYVYMEGLTITIDMNFVHRCPFH